MERIIDIGRLARWQSGIIATLIAAHLAIHYASVRSGHPYMMGIVPLLDLDGESNLAAFYQALTLLAAGVVLLHLGGLERRRPWIVLGCIFVFMAADEAALLHELSGIVFLQVTGLQVLGFAWVFPFSVVLLAVAVYFTRFLWSLPWRLRLQILLCGATYIGGAVGVEILAWSTQVPKSLAYSSLVAVEEGMEMIGVGAFLQVVLRHVAVHGGTVALRLVTPSARSVIVTPHEEIRPARHARRVASA